MIFLCRCAKCESIYNGNIDDNARIEIDFVEQEIRFVCPQCKKENKISILTTNKKNAAPLPRINIMRG